MSYQEQILLEIQHTPQAFLPNLLEIIRLYRESVSVQVKPIGVDEFPLRGSVLKYDDPFGPATPIDDWEVLR